MKRLLTISLLSFFVACSTNPQKEKGIKEIAREIMVASKNCALITVDSSGVANARAMDPFLPEEDFTVWMATNPKSKKVQDILNNPKVTLYYFDKNDPGYVTIQGNATLINDADKKEKFWKEEWKNFYKDRKTDYLLIKVIPRKLNVISERHRILGDSITWRAPEINFNTN
ncbi:pyridoxamine 5'-phosphate oxidase family protein [Flavobacteriaceae bacterium S356]|uniref:Pyridoxamine 5'-phosphate oxidase family protein n=1 Tax=Asprobacillus argus TaxID=3076534 RepID=A0ABU3LAQ3_9FLAO|nr:pyridoxamine 5'-phosphate oxidase family protein [Flavobacteriaceae bacterium S356]